MAPGPRGRTWWLWGVMTTPGEDPGAAGTHGGTERAEPDGSVEAVQDESDACGLFQVSAGLVPSWEELIETLGRWWDAGRQVDGAIAMVRALAGRRQDRAYSRWVHGPLETLQIGFGESSWTNEEETPPDFFAWATEVEHILHLCFLRDVSRGLVPGIPAQQPRDDDSEGVQLMERGRRGGERHRGRHRSRTREGRDDADRGEEHGWGEGWADRGRSARGSGHGPTGSADGGRAGSGATADRIARHLERAPWRCAQRPRPTKTEAEARSSGSTGPAEANASDEDVDMTLTFYPRAPRNADDGVDIWRYLLGLCVSDLPRGRSTVPAGGPLVPDDRAEYIREVLRGLTMDQQIIMTSAFVTTIRALMYEVGVIMHIASLSEPVALDPTTDEEPGPAETRRDRGDHTSLLQMEVETGTLEAGVNLVQMDLSRVYGVVLRLQGALERASAEVAGSRARVLLEKLRTQRGCGVLRDIELFNQLEALLVAVAGTGGQGETSEGAGSATEASDWSAQWWKAFGAFALSGGDRVGLCGADSGE